MILVECVTMAHKFFTMRWTEESARVPSDLRITFGQYKVLSLIATGCTNMGQIIDANTRPEGVSDRLWIADRSVTSTRIDDLVRRNMITQKKRPDDKRSYHIGITEKGEAALARARVVDAKVEGAARKKIDPSAIKGAIEALRILAMANIEKDVGDATNPL